MADLSNDNLSYRAKRISTPPTRDTDISIPYLHECSHRDGAARPERGSIKVLASALNFAGREPTPLSRSGPEAARQILGEDQIRPFAWAYCGSALTPA